MKDCHFEFHPQSVKKNRRAITAAQIVPHAAGSCWWEAGRNCKYRQAVATAQIYNGGPGSAGNCWDSHYCFSTTTIFDLENIPGRIPGSRAEKNQRRGGQIKNLQGQNTFNNC